MSDVLTPIGNETLEPRIYDFGGKEVRIVRDSVKSGVRGKTIFKNCPRLYLRNDAGPENIFLKDIILDNILVYTDQAGGGMCEAVKFDNLEFTNGSKFQFLTGLKNSEISNCLFSGAGVQAIYGYNYNGLTIRNNDFIGVRQFAHIDALAQSYSLKWFENYGTGWSGIGLELQTLADGVDLHDNRYEAPNTQNPADLATYSAILDRSTNVRIRREYFGAAPQAVWHVEAGGGSKASDATIIEDNYVEACKNFVVVTDRNGGYFVVVQNNLMTGNWRIADESHQGTFQSVNNNGLVKLSWDKNRARPGRNRSLTPTPIPPDPIPPTPIKLITSVVVNYSDGTNQVVK